MKFMLLIAITLFSSLTFAGETYVCTEVNGDKYNPRKMILRQYGEEKVTEGKWYAFRLDIVKGTQTILSENIYVQLEDVLFGFNNRAKNIEGMIYLDEMNESWLKVGKQTIHFDCY